MSSRVRLHRNWRVRPVQEGLELMSPEHNLSLELSDVAFRDILVSVLTGDADIPEEDDAVQGIMQQLLEKGILLPAKDGKDFSQSVAKEKDELGTLRAKLVGNRGPVTSVYWLDPEKSRLPLFGTHLFTAKYEERTGKGEEVTEGWASGSDTQWEQAELKAIMEALERHASGVIPWTELTPASVKELGRKAIDPRYSMAYTDHQYGEESFPLTQFKSDQRYWWKKIDILGSGETKYIPAECVYYPFPVVQDPIVYASSSGVAASFSREDAFLRGLYEAIERDAFMLVWLNRMRMPIVDTTTLSEAQQKRITLIESLGYRACIVDITLDVAPVALAIAMSESQHPALVLGAAANLNMEYAADKALSELEHQMYWELRSSADISVLSDPRNVVGVLDHMALYASPQHLNKAAFLWSGPNVPARKQEEKLGFSEIQWLAERLEHAGVREIGIANMTPGYLREAGVWVMRALPFGLVPISFGHGMEPLGMERIRKFKGRGDPWSSGVPFTHPFA